MGGERPLLHICYAPADRGWVHGRMVHEIGLEVGQYLTREDDGLGAIQLQAIEHAVDQCRFTILVASTAARWDRLTQFAAGLAQHAGFEGDLPRLIVVARDFTPRSEDERDRLSLGQRALVSLDCSDDAHTVAALAQLRKQLALPDPRDVRPLCPYPGLAPFTPANRELLFGRDADRDAILQRIRAGQTRILVVGPSGSGKSSLVRAAVLPELSSHETHVQVVPRSGDLASALRATIDALEVPGLGPALDAYREEVRHASVVDAAAARAKLGAVAVPDPRRRVVVIDPLEEIFAYDDNASERELLFALLGGLWSLSWCTVVLCMRADFYGALMAERCWRELEGGQYTIAPLEEAGLRAAIVAPAARAGVHVDAALVERLVRELDRDRSSVPLPVLQVALQELWARLRWRYLTLVDYERILDRDQRGLSAVLAVHANSVLQHLAPDDRAVAQRILLDLVHLGEGRPHTRRRRATEDLRRTGDPPEQLERVLDALIAGRLVTMGDSAAGDVVVDGEPSSLGETNRLGRHVDLAHDTLITGWPELAGWIISRRDDLQKQRRLEQRAEARALLTSDELPEFARWLAWVATPPGQALGASEALQRLVRRSVVARRLRWAGFMAGIVAVTAVAIVFALQTRRLRNEKAKTAHSIEIAMQTADAIEFKFNEKLKTMACEGAADTRKYLLLRLHELVNELRQLGVPRERGQRAVMVAKSAEAELALERGKLDEAYSLYREALSDAERRASVDGGNPTWQDDLSVLCDRLGDVAVSAGKLDDARGWFLKSLSVRETRAKAEPGNADEQRGISVSHNKLGDVEVRAGKLGDARGWFLKALALGESLAKAAPNNADMQRDLSVSYERLGDVEVRAGNFDEARIWFLKALALGEILAKADPSNANKQLDLSVSYEKLGDVAIRAGKLDDARGWFQKSLAVRETLTEVDPCNADKQRARSVSYNKLGDVAVRAGKLDDARGWFQKALAVSEALAKADPGNADKQRDLWASYERLGDGAVRAGKLDEARSWLEKDLAVGDALAKADPSNADKQRDLSVSYERLGNVAMRAGELDDARAWLQKGLEVRRKLSADHPNNPELQPELCRTLAMTAFALLARGDFSEANQRFAEARSLYGRLHSDGLFQGDASFAELGAALDDLSAQLRAARKQ